MIRQRQIARTILTLNNLEKQSSDFERELCQAHLQVQPHGAPKALKDRGAKFNLNAAEIANKAGSPLATTSFRKEEAMSPKAHTNAA